MATYERNGIHVDQCTECRGLFLDRGELEHLIAAEAKWNAPVQQPPAQPAPSNPGYQSGYQPNYHHKKKRSFLEELFD